jgi:hypothetical protein
MKKNSINFTFVVCLLIFVLFSCDKNGEIQDDKDSITKILKCEGNLRHRIEYTIEYPNWVKLGDKAIISVQSNVVTGSPENLKTYNFYNPTNGSITAYDVPNDNPNITIRKFMFQPASMGEAKIYSNENVCSVCPNYITITVY